MSFISYQRRKKVEIMSPHYMAVRDGNESTIQKGAVKNSGPAKTAEQGDVSEKA